MQKITLRAKYARNLPDPVFTGLDTPKVQRHIFLCSVLDVPVDIPKDANPREQNIDKRIYKDISRHLINEEGTPNTFHLKNKGVTILASQVRKLDEDEDGITYEVAFDKGQGIVDGAHTYEIIKSKQDHIREFNSANERENAIDQHVKFEVITGLQNGLVAEIAAGLNTAVQVQQMALKDLEGKYDWIKEELRGTPYFNDIAFTQNAKGEYDIRDILVMMELFNISSYPNKGTAYPTRTWNSKESVLSTFGRDSEPYEKLRPILKDILHLYDLVGIEARDKYNEGGGRKGGALTFVERKTSKPFRFPFIDDESEYRLFRGALLPMVGAFRWMVVEDKVTGNYKWRNGFDEVLSLWNETGQELMDATLVTSNELGRKLTALGKSPNLWARLHSIVTNRYLLRYAELE